MKGVIEIIIEIDQDSFSFYILIRCCPMKPSSSGLPDDVAFLMAIMRTSNKGERETERERETETERERERQRDRETERETGR